MRILLLHPPLLSPVVWCRLAPIFERAGHEVAAPALATTSVRTWWREARDLALSTMPDAEIVVAHSGAGVLVPEVVAALPDIRAAVFVDATLPSVDGMSVSSATVRARVAALAAEGVLPPWPRWWPPAELDALVPDAQDRLRLCQDAPCLPTAFFDVPVPVPTAWEPPLLGYLRLSPAYDEVAEQARRRRWRVTGLDGHHLDVLARPGPVGAAILDLAGCAVSSGGAVP